jgi:hypothetical protein
MKINNEMRTVLGASAILVAVATCSHLRSNSTRDGSDDGDAFDVMAIRSAAARDMARNPSFDQRAWLTMSASVMSQPPDGEQIDIVTEQIGLANAVSRIVERLPEAGRSYVDRTGVVISNPEGLWREVGVALTAYLSGSKDAVLEYRTRRRDQHVVGECDEATWVQALRTLDHASLGTQVLLRPRILDGIRLDPVSTLPVTDSTVRLWQLSGVPGEDQDPPANVNVYEIVIPVEAKDAEGHPFVGYLGVWMTTGEGVGEPASREWRCTTISVYNRPDGGIVPPLL